MKKLLIAVLPAVFLLVGCLVGPGPGGYGVSVVPALPSLVELSVDDPYYYHGGYYYHYQNERWLYGNTQGGPWSELPRDRYPKEVRYKSRGNDNPPGQNRGQEKHDNN